MRYFLLILTCCLGMFITPTLSAQQRVKVMQYNLLLFGNQDPCAPPLTDKDTWLRSIVNHYRPDIFTVNELIPNVAYVNRIKQLAFNFTGDIEAGELTNDAGSNIANMIFYNETILGYDAEKSTVIANPLRDINVYALYHLASAQTGDTTYLYCIVTHFKAGQSTADANTRAVAAQSISNWINTQGQGKNILVMGDLNIYTPAEQAYQTLVLNSDTTRRLVDPTGLTSGWGNNTAIHMTQSTRSSGSDCGAGGGMDDRFDFILANKTLWRSEAGISYVPGSYAAFGNDGLGFNGPLNCSNNTPVPSGICLSLLNMSDHLPVVMELEFDPSTGLDAVHFLSGVSVKLIGHPFDEVIHITIQDDRSPQTPLSLELLNIQGRILARQPIQAGAQVVQIPSQNLSTGIYLLKVSSSNGQFISQRVMIR